MVRDLEREEALEHLESVFGQQGLDFLRTLPEFEHAVGKVIHMHHDARTSGGAYTQENDAKHWVSLDKDALGIQPKDIARADTLKNGVQAPGSIVGVGQKAEKLAPTFGTDPSKRW